MKYHLSAVSLEGMQGQGKFSPSRAYSSNPPCPLILNQITHTMCVLNK